MEDDKPTENNVFEFSKRFEDKTGKKPPELKPKWDVAYWSGEQLVEETIEGYIFSLMPTLMFADKADLINSANETIFAIPYETLKRLKRVKEETVSQ